MDLSLTLKCPLVRFIHAHSQDRSIRSTRLLESSSPPLIVRVHVTEFQSLGVNAVGMRDGMNLNYCRCRRRGGRRRRLARTYAVKPHVCFSVSMGS